MYKSREILVYLHPDQFLRLAKPLPESPYSAQNIQELASLMRGGTQMSDIPFLMMDKYGRIDGHEGRHRANALKRMGYQKMPVRLTSSDYIRWSEQIDPNNNDYVARLPDVLISEDGTKAMEVPFETEGPRRGMARPEYADNTAQRLPRPDWDWEGQRVYKLDYEGRMLPEFGSEEYFDAHTIEQRKAEARALLKRDVELGRVDPNPSNSTLRQYEENLEDLYRSSEFRELSTGFVEQARHADGEPFNIGRFRDRYTLRELAEQEIYWHPTENKAEIAQRKEEIIKERYEQQLLDDAYDRELEAKRLAKELEEQRMLETLTPQERAAYLKKKDESFYSSFFQLLQRQPQEPRMADNMVDVYGRKLTEEQALKELSDLQEQFRVTASDSRAYNELRGEIRLLENSLENYYTQVPATTRDIFGDPVESRRTRHAEELRRNTRKGYSPQAAISAIPYHEQGQREYYNSQFRPDPSDFLEDPVVTRTMETGLPEDFGPPGTVRDPLANVPPEYREAVRNPTPTVRGDTKTFIDAFDEFASGDPDDFGTLFQRMRQDPAMEETLRMYNERAGEVRRIQRELAENPSRSVRNMLLGQLEDAKGNLFNMQMNLEKKASEIQERRALAAKQLDERVSSAIAEPRIEDEVFGREMETQRQERQVMRGEAAQRGSARTGLSAMLESEGIPRDSFLDFVELPENRRSGKSIPQLIEAYKISAELPASAGVPRGRPRRAIPVEGLASDPILQSGTYTDEFGETVRRPTSMTASPTSDQRAFSDQDPETGLRVFTPTDVDAEVFGDDDLLMRSLFADDDMLEAGIDMASGYGMDAREYRDRVRTQADLYDELLSAGRTPALDFNDPISRSAYEIAEQRVAARGSAAGPSQAIRTMEDRGSRRSPIQFLSQAAEEGQSLPTPTDVLPTGSESRGERQMIVGGSNIPENQMVVSGENVGSLAREGQTEAGQGVLRGAAAAEPSGARVSNVTGTTYDQRPRLGPTDAPDPGEGMRLSPKFTADAEQLRDILANPDIKAKISQSQLSRLERLAAKSAPILRALGNAALAGELLYYTAKERSVPKGVMAAGAASVEGTGALLGLPQAAYETLAPNYEERAESGMLSRPEVLAEGAAAIGRGIASTVGAYGREKQRKQNREIYNEAREYGQMVLGLSYNQAMEFGKDYMRDYHSAMEQGQESPTIDPRFRQDPLEERDVLADGMR